MIPILNLDVYLSQHSGTTDVTELERRLASELSTALREVGFFSIVNHGIPRTLVNELLEQARRFHALPSEAKMRLKLHPQMAGYQTLGGTKHVASKIADNPGFNLNAAFLMRNNPEVDQWPEELVGFREKVTEYFHAMESLSYRLLPLYAVALGLPRLFFTDHFRNARAILRLAHYPVVAGAEGRHGSAPHTDAGFMTLIPDNEIEGLAIRPPGGTWVDVPRIPNSILINSGDILRRWTNEFFLSTEHMVRASVQRERYGIPFFISPRHDVNIACLPSCRSEGNPPRYQPILCGAYHDWFVSQNFLGAPKTPPP